MALDDSKKNTIQYSFKLYSLKALVLHTTWPCNLFLQPIPKRSPTKGERPASNLDCNFASMWRRCNAIGRGGVQCNIWNTVPAVSFRYLFKWVFFYILFYTILFELQLWNYWWHQYESLYGLKVVEQRLVSNWHTYLSVVPKIWNQRL